MRYARKIKFSIHGVVLMAAASAMADTALQTPGPINRVVYAQPFTLEEGFRFPTRKERP